MLVSNFLPDGGETAEFCRSWSWTWSCCWIVPPLAHPSIGPWPWPSYSAKRHWFGLLFAMYIYLPWRVVLAFAVCVWLACFVFGLWLLLGWLWFPWWFLGFEFAGKGMGCLSFLCSLGFLLSCYLHSARPEFQEFPINSSHCTLHMHILYTIHSSHFPLPTPTPTLTCKAKAKALSKKQKQGWENRSNFVPYTTKCKCGLYVHADTDTLPHIQMHAHCKQHLFQWSPYIFVFVYSLAACLCVRLFVCCRFVSVSVLNLWYWYWHIQWHLIQVLQQLRW